MTVGAGSRLFQARTKDISASGAKILLKERLPVGTEVALRFRPAGRAPVETRALVWRADADGLAFLFVGSQGPGFLACVTPPQAVLATAPDTGTVLPVSATAPASEERDTGTVLPVSATAPASEGRGTGTVLLATLDPDMRALVVAALGRRGYIVLDAGPQPLLALRIAQEHPGTIDLLLVDAELQLMNGAPLTERLVPLRPSSKILLMANSTGPSPTTRGALLPTPCTQEDLATRVRQVLHG